MRTAAIRTGDIVRLNKRGHEFEAFVTDRNGGELVIEPIRCGISYRTARAREITAHWAKRARATNRA
jgi:hypothetical protein